MIDRLISAIATLLPLMLFRAISGRLTGGRSAMIYKLAAIAGVRNITEDTVTLLGMAASIYAGAFGYFVHLMLGDKGFGYRTNGFLGFVGGAGVVAALLAISGNQARLSAAGLWSGTMLGSTFLLLAACWCKSLLISRVTDHALGVRTPSRAAPQGVGRMEAVLQRRR
ncbi:MAG: hypothetical protein ACR652_07225 [Methylocystis sp.]|uniref:hypothetical protein n=1 Tax=Methylocystis sp. TaxID=1911079 RepID=UPI003DA22F9F